MGSDQPVDPPVPLSTTVHRGVDLREVIERELEPVRRGVEVLIWRMDLAKTHADKVELAADTLQEVVRRALDNVNTFDGHRSAHAWLFGIAANVLQEHRRRVNRERQRYAGTIESLDMSHHEAESGHGVDPLVVQRLYALAADDGQRLIELLDLVPLADRQILTYRYVDQLDGRAIAAKLGISEGTARVRLSRAVDKLTTAFYRSERTLERGTQR